VSLTTATAGEEIPMPTASTRSSAAKSTSTTRSRSKADPDAIKLLKADHKEVKAMFDEYEKLVDSEADSATKQELARQICTALTVHATVEEELFYPAARAELEENEDLLDEAEVEHACAKDLIAQLEASTPEDDPLYDAKVKVLGEYIQHHVDEEEGEMFPKVKKTDLDLDALGQEMAARKAQLMPQQ
jgi:hemerythrin superfamily protein